MKQQRPTLSELEGHDEFIQRHIGPNSADQQAMLAQLGLSSLDELIDRVVPADIRLQTPLAVSEGQSEAEVLEQLRLIGSKNQLFKSYIGMGYYNTLTPSVIQRNILENPAWYTAYTPYQSEISQGRLEALLNFQTMITDLTGMELANASMLDEATAAAEAMTLCQRMSKSKGKVFFVAEDCHPQTINVIQTRANPIGIEVVVGNPTTDIEGLDLFGALLQYPGTFGEISDYREVIKQVHEKKALVTMAADLLALTLITPPGELGADVAIGTAQRLGVPLGYGGPHAGYMATREAFKRSMPGRLIGVSLDRHGNKAYRLALATREQHIRREKATSNICTAQALLAIIAVMYTSYHGPEGLKRIAQRVHRLTTLLSEGLSQLGLSVKHQNYFDTITINTAGRSEQYLAVAKTKSINLRPIDDQTLSISIDETTTRADLVDLLSIFAESEQSFDIEALEANASDALPESLLRESSFLNHPVFNSYHSETEMMRYLRKLADKDLALDRAMIPLGSCTMKLNAATEMQPITWAEFSGIHPFVPREQVQGYKELCGQLEEMLCACTGYAAVSLQPNAGSQGEYAGLLAIKAYHESRGEGHRNICLIPSSAHGTNPASAAMVGMKVTVVSCDQNGNINLDDLKEKVEKHSDNLAAIMITYPSTHGVFEEAVREVCDIVHQHGGQVYLDGANLNAMVGLCAPGEFGGDVSHLNLHKTFAIPHGGGGPGVGPIGVREHLKPFLPGHSLESPESGTVGPVSAAPWGSAGILPITWSYIALLGREGLTQATKIAILNANYIAAHLAPHFPILYSGAKDMVAHECIIDLRALKDETGITVDDVAKRLIDFGFHAPTMSFPVAGTFMIEPTESESKSELDRFISAMVTIRAEIDSVAKGEIDAEDNPLRNAPHTADDLIAAEWSHPYSREQAIYPTAELRNFKYWAPVARIDNIYGDRQLVCTCPDISEYEEPEASGKSAAA